jgi:hypothetical protein
MDPLTSLLCGNHHSCGEISQIFSHLGDTVDDFARRCYDFICDRNDEDLSAFGPYCGRSILETACTILIGRIDPYRLLLVKRYQERPDYNISVRHKISVQWFGDIIASEKPPPWEKLSSKNIPRALFTDEYTGEIYWKQALADLLNDTRDEDRSGWLEELRQKPENIENIGPYLREEADRLYSSLSKGIHQEFVVSISAAYDSQTIKDLLKDTIALVAKLALISHYIPISLGKITKAALLGHLIKIEERCGYNQ